jgi:hypothetical protein
MLGKRQVKHRGDESAVWYLPRFNHVNGVSVRERGDGGEVQQILIPRFGPFVLLHQAGAGVELAPPLLTKGDEQRLNFALMRRGHDLLQDRRGAPGARQLVV